MGPTSTFFAYTLCPLQAVSLYTRMQIVALSLQTQSRLRPGGLGLMFVSVVRVCSYLSRQVWIGAPPLPSETLSVSVMVFCYAAACLPGCFLCNVLACFDTLSPGVTAI